LTLIENTNRNNKQITISAIESPLFVGQSYSRACPDMVW